MPELTRLVIVGAGGFGREVLDIVEARQASGDSIEFLGFVDDGEVNLDRLERRGVKLLGTPSDLSAGTQYTIGVGVGSIRARLAVRLGEAGASAHTLVHPLASVGGDTILGDGCILAAGARLTTNVRLGRHVDVHVNATIGHDSVLNDFVSVYPGATVGGAVRLGQFVTIGTGANVLPGVTVGAGAYVGAGAVVVKDVPPGVTVVGVPARALRT